MAESAPAVSSFSIADPFLTLFISFLAYLFVILSGICIVWLFPIIKNGSVTPSPDVFIRWATTAAAFVHSIVMTSIGVFVVFMDASSTRNIFEGKSPSIPTFVAWEVGHLAQQALFKCYLMIENNRSQGFWQLSKHVGLIFSLPWYSRVGVSDFFMGLFFLSYFSDVFWNLRSLLARAGKEQSRLYRFVSFMCPISFVLCRFLPIFCVLFHDGNGLEYRPNWHNEIPFWSLFFMLIAFLFNSIAFYRMLKHKTIRKSLKLI